MSRFAAGISDHELGDYQRAARLILRYGLVTATWPDAKALPRVRRFSDALRQDLAGAFGYRLELHGSTARLVRVRDGLDATQPARTRPSQGASLMSGRPFDRRRYAYLMLCLAVLGRAGVQITLSELADSVAADANRITGLGLDPDRGVDRRAFVDSVGWLELRGALTLADGSASAWASDPGVGEALYDVARDVLFALYRPTRMVQAVPTVRALLDRSAANSGNEERRLAGQAARRAVVERPVVYFAEVSDAVANHLRGPALADDLRRLLGLRLERRSEGVLLVDNANFSSERFPGSSAPARVAVLLAVEMADRIIDPDGRRVRRVDAISTAAAEAELVALVDAGMPEASRVPLPFVDDGATAYDDGDAGDGRLPFIAESFLRTAVTGILARFEATFSVEWHGDPERLRSEAVALLARFGCVRPVPGGVLVLPLVGRYRNTVATTSTRREQAGLF
jgi:uncharacterized protein (TIGR02678 family)